MPRKKVLGRGLNALIGDIDTSDLQPGSFFYCNVEVIRPNPYQPRRSFGEEELGRLADSIKAKGVIQPLIVRPVSGSYELVVGERRLRAARMAGLKEVPVVVKEISAAGMLEMALVENIQREGLNPLERAQAYHRLMQEFGLTQEEVASRVAQDRSTVANFLRLRNLPEPIQADIANNTLTMGHARVLVGIEAPAQQKAVWRRIASENLSVRSAEALAQRLKAKKGKASASMAPSSEDIYFQSLVNELTHELGTKVSIMRRGKKGKLEIEFYDNNDLDRLVRRLKGNFSNS